MDDGQAQPSVSRSDFDNFDPTMPTTTIGGPPQLLPTPTTAAP